MEELKEKDFIGTNPFFAGDPEKIEELDGMIISREFLLSKNLYDKVVLKTILVYSNLKIKTSSFYF